MHRDTEVYLAPLKNETLNQKILHASQGPPLALKELESFHTKQYCTNVTHYDKTTYFGFDNGVIDTLNDAYTALIELRKHVAGLDVCKSGIFVSTDGYPNRVGHYDNYGRLITAWAHTDTKGCWSSNLAVVGEKVVPVDKAGHTLLSKRFEKPNFVGLKRLFKV